MSMKRSAMNKKRIKNEICVVCRQVIRWVDYVGWTHKSGGGNIWMECPKCNWKGSQIENCYACPKCRTGMRDMHCAFPLQ